MLTPTEFIIKIDQYSPELHSLYSQTGARSALFITAWNPYSQPLSDNENEIRQQYLIKSIAAAGYEYHPGEGKHPDNNWPAEKSIFILGSSKEDSVELGKKYGQNAVVWACLLYTSPSPRD